MKWISVVGLSVACATLPAVLSAAPVSYSTSGVFSTTGTNMLPIGGGNLIFNGVVSNVVNVPSNISFGTFDTSGAGTGTIPAGETFTLTITDPFIIGGTNDPDVTATISGSMDPNSSSVLVSFNTTSLSIDGNEYTISQPAGGIMIVPASSDKGLVTLQGTVVPEPATYLSLASGIAILGIALYRRLRA